MAEKHLYIGYDDEADELIITSKPKAETVGYFIDSGVAVMLGLHDFRPYGLSFILLKEYFKKHHNAFAKIPLTGNIKLPATIRKQLKVAGNLST